MDLFMAEKIDYDKFKYMNEELDGIIKENEINYLMLKNDTMKMLKDTLN